MTTTTKKDRDHSLSRRELLGVGSAAVVASAGGLLAGGLFRGTSRATPATVASQHGASRLPAGPAASGEVGTVRGRMMGSFLEVAARREFCPKADRVVTLAMTRIEQRMSLFLKTSELCQVNRAAATKETTISTELGEVLAACEAMHRKTDGAFDPTVGPIVAAYGFLGAAWRRGGSTPDRAALQEALRHVGLQHVVREDDRVGFDHPRVMLDLGGIAVGYGVDQAIEALRQAEIGDALINAGGDLRVLGQHPSGRPWTVGIQHPDDPRKVLASAQLPAGMALTTSGTYAKSVKAFGRRVSHIIDPRTGDAPGDVLSATVVAQTTVEADALATAAVVLGAREGLALLERLPDVEGLLVVTTAGGGRKVQGTSGMRVTIHHV